MWSSKPSARRYDLEFLNRMMALFPLSSRNIVTCRLLHMWRSFTRATSASWRLSTHCCFVSIWIDERLCFTEYSSSLSSSFSSCRALVLLAAACKSFSACITIICSSSVCCSWSSDAEKLTTVWLCAWSPCLVLLSQKSSHSILGIQMPSRGMWQLPTVSAEPKIRYIGHFWKEIPQHLQIPIA